MLTEAEYDVARRLAERNGDNEHVKEGRRIVSELFGHRDALGVLRIREHPLFTDRFDMRKFLEVLADIV